MRTFAICLLILTVCQLGLADTRTMKDTTTQLESSIATIQNFGNLKEGYLVLTKSETEYNLKLLDRNFSTKREFAPKFSEPLKALICFKKNNFCLVRLESQINLVFYNDDLYKTTKGFISPYETDNKVFNVCITSSDYFFLAAYRPEIGILRWNINFPDSYSRFPVADLETTDPRHMMQYEESPMVLFSHKDSYFLHLLDFTKMEYFRGVRLELANFLIVPCLRKVGSSFVLLASGTRIIVMKDFKYNSITENPSALTEEVVEGLAIEESFYSLWITNNSEILILDVLETKKVAEVVKYTGTLLKGYANFLLDSQGLLFNTGTHIKKLNFSTDFCHEGCGAGCTSLLSNESCVGSKCSPEYEYKNNKCVLKVKEEPPLGRNLVIEGRYFEAKKGFPINEPAAAKNIGSIANKGVYKTKDAFSFFKDGLIIFKKTISGLGITIQNSLQNNKLDNPKTFFFSSKVKSINSSTCYKDREICLIGGDSGVIVFGITQILKEIVVDSFSIKKETNNFLIILHETDYFLAAQEFEVGVLRWDISELTHFIHFSFTFLKDEKPGKDFAAVFDIKFSKLALLAPSDSNRMRIMDYTNKRIKEVVFELPDSITDGIHIYHDPKECLLMFAHKNNQKLAFYDFCKKTIEGNINSGYKCTIGVSIPYSRYTIWSGTVRTTMILVPEVASLKGITKLGDVISYSKTISKNMVYDDRVAGFAGLDANNDVFFFRLINYGCWEGCEGCNAAMSAKSCHVCKSGYVRKEGGLCIKNFGRFAPPLFEKIKKEDFETTEEEFNGKKLKENLDKITLPDEDLWNILEMKGQILIWKKGSTSFFTKNLIDTFEQDSLKDRLSPLKIEGGDCSKKNKLCVFYGEDKIMIIKNDFEMIEIEKKFIMEEENNYKRFKKPSKLRLIEETEYFLIVEVEKAGLEIHSSNSKTFYRITELDKKSEAVCEELLPIPDTPYVLLHFGESYKMYLIDFSIMQKKWRYSLEQETKINDLVYRDENPEKGEIWMIEKMSTNTRLMMMTYIDKSKTKILDVEDSSKLEIVKRSNYLIIYSSEKASLLDMNTQNLMLFFSRNDMGGDIKLVKQIDGNGNIIVKIEKALFLIEFEKGRICHPYCKGGCSRILSRHHCNSCKTGAGPSCEENLTNPPEGKKPWSSLEYLGGQRVNYKIEELKEEIKLVGSEYKIDVEDNGLYILGDIDNKLMINDRNGNINLLDINNISTANSLYKNDKELDLKYLYFWKEKSRVMMITNDGIELVMIRFKESKLELEVERRYNVSHKKIKFDSVIGIGSTDYFLLTSKGGIYRFDITQQYSYSQWEQKQESNLITSLVPVSKALLVAESEDKNMIVVDVSKMEEVKRFKISDREESYKKILVLSEYKDISFTRALITSTNFITLLEIETQNIIFSKKIPNSQSHFTQIAFSPLILSINDKKMIYIMDISREKEMEKAWPHCSIYSQEIQINYVNIINNRLFGILVEKESTYILRELTTTSSKLCHPGCNKCSLGLNPTKCTQSNEGYKLLDGEVRPSNNYKQYLSADISSISFESELISTDSGEQSGIGGELVIGSSIDLPEGLNPPSDIISTEGVTALLSESGSLNIIDEDEEWNDMVEDMDVKDVSCSPVGSCMLARKNTLSLIKKVNLENSLAIEKEFKVEFNEEELLNYNSKVESIPNTDSFLSGGRKSDGLRRWDTNYPDSFYRADFDFERRILLEEIEMDPFMMDINLIEDTPLATVHFEEETSFTTIDVTRMDITHTMNIEDTNLDFRLLVEKEPIIALLYIKYQPKLSKIISLTKSKLLYFDYTHKKLIHQHNHFSTSMRGGISIGETKYAIWYDKEKIYLHDTELSKAEEDKYLWVMEKEIKGVISLEWEEKKGWFRVLNGEKLWKVEYSGKNMCHQSCIKCTKSFSPYFCKSCSGTEKKEDIGRCTGKKDLPPFGEFKYSKDVLKGVRLDAKTGKKIEGENKLVEDEGWLGLKLWVWLLIFSIILIVLVLVVGIGIYFMTKKGEKKEKKYIEKKEDKSSVDDNDINGGNNESQYEYPSQLQDSYNEGEWSQENFDSYYQEENTIQGSPEMREKADDKEEIWDERYFDSHVE